MTPLLRAIILALIGLACLSTQPSTSPPLAALKGALAPYAARLGIVVKRDADERPVSFRFPRQSVR